jgi:hypothetical protein
MTGAGLALCLMFCLMACANGKRLQPPNQINEPVFYSRPYAALGLGLGEQLNFQRDFTQRYATPKKQLLVEPVLTWFYPLNAWAGFYLLPTYWTFLLTGEQYDTTAGFESLRTGKLHLALSGGLSGLAYSGREGWEAQFQVLLQGKYRFSERVFSQADYSRLIFGNFETALDGWNAGLGYQWLPALSVFVNYQGAVLTLSEYQVATLNGMEFQDNDLLSVVSVTTPWYVTPKHVVTPEIAYGHRNSSGREGSLIRAGLQYRFVFD